MLRQPDECITDEKFRTDYQAYRNAKTREEKKKLIDDYHRWRATLTPEEREEDDRIARRSVEEFLAAVKANNDELGARMARRQLEELSDGLSLDYIAQHYLGQSKEWLAQRMSGAIVNGKPARFNPDELQQLQHGIREYGARLAATTLI